MIDPKFENILNQYIVYLQVEKKAKKRTQTTYITTIKYFLNFCSVNLERLFLYQDWNLQDIGKPEVEFFVHEHIYRHQWKIQSLASYVSALRSFFRFLHEKEYIKENPLYKFTVKGDLEDFILAQVPEEEIAKLFQDPPDKTMEGYRDRLLLELFYGMGIPPSKLIKITNIELLKDQKELIIYQNKRSWQHPVGESAIVILINYQEYRKQILDELPEINAGYWINHQGKTLSLYQLNQIFKKQIESIEILRNQPHFLRDVSTKHFADHGADVRTLRKFRNARSFERLEHFKQENLEDIWEQFRKVHIREKT